MESTQKTIERSTQRKRSHKNKGGFHKVDRFLKNLTHTLHCVEVTCLATVMVLQVALVLERVIASSGESTAKEEPCPTCNLSGGKCLFKQGPDAAHCEPVKSGHPFNAQIATGDCGLAIAAMEALRKLKTTADASSSDLAALTKNLARLQKKRCRATASKRATVVPLPLSHPVSSIPDSVAAGATDWANTDEH